MKTIIFPTIGFPIIRDTVLYKKFSCYQKGELERIPTSLRDLSYTYYTVEQISSRLKRQKNKPVIKHDTEEVDDFYDEMKKLFSNGVSNIKEIIDNQPYEIDYPTNNGMMYCVIKINELLCEDDKYRINKLSNDEFHIEIEIFSENTVINIHKKL